MNYVLAPGVYVLAVSGGVDSMVLLDLLRQRPGVRLIVAHFDHGVRADAALDRQLVQQTAAHHGLPFVYDEGRLGSGASEDAARRARYTFLETVRRASGARAIITAHHRDDVLETAILNILRGTGPRGLTALRSRPTVLRPLLDIPKSELLAYAQKHGLSWREDSTNQDLRYLRNRIRHQLLPRLSEAHRKQLLEHIRRLHELREQLDHELTNHLHLHPGRSELDRHWFIMLPHRVAREVLAAWLRRHGVADITSRRLERLTMAAKTFAPGRAADVDQTYVLQIRQKILALKVRDR